MEMRKVYISGGSTYVISLPKKWVEASNLKAGDSVAVAEQGGSLLVGAGSFEKEPSTKDIRISQSMSCEALERTLISAYITGYDTIRIKLDREDNFAYRESIRKTAGKLIGVEIVEDSHDAMTLEIMLDYKRMNTKWILQKMFFLDKSMLSDLCTAFKKRDAGLARDIIVREGEVDRLYFLVVRQLKYTVRYPQAAEKLGVGMQRDCIGYRVVVKALERIADHMETAAESWLQLSGTQKEGRLDEYATLAAAAVSVFDKSVHALFAKSHADAEAVFPELKKIEKAYSGLSKELFRAGSVQNAILRKTILDRVWRIAQHSGDIAEIAINMSA